MTAAPAVVGGVELLERAVGFTLGSLPAVIGELLGAPTPCPKWNVQRLMDHLNDGLLALADAFDDGHVEVDEECQERCPVAVVQTSASRLLGALSTENGRPAVSVGGCPMTTALLSGAGALELAVHGWDLARACGVRRPIPEGLAVELLELAPTLVGRGDRPHRFAPPAVVPATATPSDRLLAWLGRTP